jgi:hypothetical protein
VFVDGENYSTGNEESEKAKDHNKEDHHHNQVSKNFLK